MSLRILAVCLAVCLAVPAWATTYNVSTPAELTTALNSATGGDDIQLASGNYGYYTVDGHVFTSYVTITSADGNKGAVFDYFYVDYSEYVRVDGVHVSNPGNGAPSEALVFITNSDNVEFINSEVNGLVDSNYYGFYGIRSNSSTNILIKNNSIHDARIGMYFSSSASEVTGNVVEDVREDSFKFGYNTGILIKNNTGARRYHPDPDDHPDFMQIRGDSSDMTFTGNICLVESGSAPQGIYFGDGFNYTNVLIENNIIYTAAVRGISWYDSPESSATGVTVRKNTVLNIPNLPGGSTTTKVLWLDAAVSDNVVAGTTGYVGTNITAQHADPQGVAYYNDLYVNATAGLGVTIEDLEPVTGGLVDYGTGIGAEERLYELLGASPMVDYTITFAGQATDVCTISFTTEAVSVDGTFALVDGDITAFACTITATSPNLVLDENDLQYPTGLDYTVSGGAVVALDLQTTTSNMLQIGSAIAGRVGSLWQIFGEGTALAGSSNTITIGGVQ